MNFSNLKRASEINEIIPIIDEARKALVDEKTFITLHKTNGEMVRIPHATHQGQSHTPVQYTIQPAAEGGGGTMRLLSSANVDVQGARKQDIYEMVTGDFNVKFGAFRTAAVEQWYETCDLAEQIPGLMRFEVKRLAKTVDKRLREYEAAAMKAYGDRYCVYIDFCNRCYADHLQQDCNKTFYSILRQMYKMPFRKKGIQTLQARLILAKELMRLVADFFNTYWREAGKKYGYDFAPFFRYADPAPLLSPMRSLCELLTETDGGQEHYNLADDPDCINGFIVIINRVHNLGWIDEMGIQAMRMNAEGNEWMQEAIAEHDRLKAEEKEEKEEKRGRSNKKKTAHKEDALDFARLAEKYKVTNL